MSSEGILRRVAAFTDTPRGGNPAGVWVGDRLPAAEAMRQIAADVGYSETAFVSPAAGRRRTVRYYSPEAEVSFCGHATIAAGSVLGTEAAETTYHFETAVGDVPVSLRAAHGRMEVSLRSVETRHEAAGAALLDQALALLRWRRDELDGRIPPAVAYAGARHLVLAAGSAERLAGLAYDFDGLKALMLRHDLTTLQLVWREAAELFHARNPFPVGGVVEDPATGAAAAALGGYLRDAGLVATPMRFEIRQGEAMGRPSRLRVDVPRAGGVLVSGTAVPIED